MPIHKKLIAIMADIGAIEKSQNNSGQNYKFRGIDQIYAALQPLLIKHNVVLKTEIVENDRESIDRIDKNSGAVIGSQMSTVVRMRVTFIDAEDGTQEFFESLGEGLDVGDKASYKALAGAFKYAVTQGLCIPTYEQHDAEYENPEREGASRPRSNTAPPSSTSSSSGSAPKKWPLSPKQAKWLFDLLDKATEQEPTVAEGVCTKYGINPANRDDTYMTKEDFDGAINALKRFGSYSRQ